jgi:acyl-CoA thioester hydrolase
MLKNTTEMFIKFSEVDSLRVVWHGHYVRYFEDGREAFGKQYGLGYLDVYEHGLAVPLIDLQVNFKRILEYGDTAVIETTFTGIELMVGWLCTRIAIGSANSFPLQSR